MRRLATTLLLGLLLLSAAQPALPARPSSDLTDSPTHLKNLNDLNHLNHLSDLDDLNNLNSHNKVNDLHHLNDLTQSPTRSLNDLTDSPTHLDDLTHSPTLNTHHHLTHPTHHPTHHTHHPTRRLTDLTDSPSPLAALTALNELACPAGYDTLVLHNETHVGDVLVHTGVCLVLDNAVVDGDVILSDHSTVLLTGTHARLTGKISAHRTHAACVLVTATSSSIPYLHVDGSTAFLFAAAASSVSASPWGWVPTEGEEGAEGAGGEDGASAGDGAGGGDGGDGDGDGAGGVDGGDGDGNGDGDGDGNGDGDDGEGGDDDDDDDGDDDDEDARVGVRCTIKVTNSEGAFFQRIDGTADFDPASGTANRVGCDLDFRRFTGPVVLGNMHIARAEFTRMHSQMVLAAFVLSGNLLIHKSNIVLDERLPALLPGLTSLAFGLTLIPTGCTDPDHAEIDLDDLELLEEGFRYESVFVLGSLFQPAVGGLLKSISVRKLRDPLGENYDYLYLLGPPARLVEVEAGRSKKLMGTKGYPTAYLDPLITSWTQEVKLERNAGYVRVNVVLIGGGSISKLECKGNSMGVWLGQAEDAALFDTIDCPELRLGELPPMPPDMDGDQGGGGGDSDPTGDYDGGEGDYDGDDGDYDGDDGDYDGDDGDYDGDDGDYDGSDGDDDGNEGDYDEGGGDHDGDGGDYDGDGGDYDGDEGEYDGGDGDHDGDSRDYDGSNRDYDGVGADYDGDNGDYDGDTTDYDGDDGRDTGDDGDYDGSDGRGGDDG